MYSNPGFSTPFSVKDILSWTEQQQAAAHYGMDFNGYNMNSQYCGYDASRLGDQMTSMSQMSPMMNNLGGNSCLYSSNNSSPSLQPTYTNLTCSTAVSSMTSLSSSLHLPVLEGMSPKTAEQYDTTNAPTPGSDQDEMSSGNQHMQGGPPPPPNIEPAPVLTPNPSSALQPPQLVKEEHSEDHSLEKG